MIDGAAIPIAAVAWRPAYRIIRGQFPPIDLFEDIADPADWPLLIAAEMKTNPQLMESLGALDLVPLGRRVSGPGASFLMGPFTHVGPDRPSRFSSGAYGVLYAGDRFEVALFETVHRHGRFMARTKEPAGWTSQFRELRLNVAARLHDLRGGDALYASTLDPTDQSAGRQFGALLRAARSEGVVYPSRRYKGGECVGLFYPDRASNAVEARRLDYHWDGARVDLVRVSGGDVYRLTEIGR